MNELFTYVLSLERPEYKPSLDQWDNVESFLYSAGFKLAPAVGKYNGQVERSFILTSDTELNECLIQTIANKFNQDCFLKVTPDSKAYLVYPDKREYIGLWAEVNDFIARQLPGFTFNVVTQKVYGVI